MADTKRLAALQPTYVKALLAQWEQTEPETFREQGRRMDPLSDRYSPDLHREVVRRVIGLTADLLIGAGERGVDLVLLPEAMLATGSLNHRSTRAALEEMCAWSAGEYLDRIAPIARRYEMAIASCFYRVQDGNVYNAGVLTDETGAVAGVYHKVHLPGESVVDPLADSEAGVIAAGSDYPVLECRAGRVGFLICYDIDFPEAASCAALGGAQILLHPSVGYNFPDEEEGMGEARLRTRAVDTMCPLVYANYGGAPGCSCVINHSGTVVAKVGRESPALAFADVPVGEPRGRDMFWKGYEHRSTLLRKRRPDTYGVLTQRLPPVLAGAQGPGERLYDYRPEVGLE